MADYIDRQAMLKHIEKIRHDVQMMDDIRRASIIMSGVFLCEAAVMNQPSADIQPVPHGRWVLFDGYYCSNCHYKIQTTGLPSYCPSCGARMDGERK